MQNDLQVTENFNLREFQCKGKSCCGGAVKADPVQVQKLQKLRDILKAPIIVNCGYRCGKHNDEIGGVPDSVHTREGRAFDISTKGTGLTPAQLASICVFVGGFRRAGAYGFGTYPGKWGYHGKRAFVHVDDHDPAQLGPKAAAFWGDWNGKLQGRAPGSRYDRILKRVGL